MSFEAIHLGDGAYASITEHGDLIITANHHDPDKASDVVSIENIGIKLLVKFIEEMDDHI